MVFLFADFVRISQNDAQKYDNPVESQPYLGILPIHATVEAMSLIQVSFRWKAEGPQLLKSPGQS